MFNGNKRDNLIEEEAAKWLAKASRGLNSREKVEFQNWLEAGTGHKEAFEEMSETRQGLRKLSQFIPEDQPWPDPDLFAPEKETSRTEFIWWRRFASLGIAASIAAALIISFNSRPVETPENDGSTVFTESYTADSLERHFLPDGSMIELNEGSSIEVALSDSIRQVTLKNGEAHFSVAKDSNRPFEVRAGSAKFRAIGTGFVVRLFTDKVEMLVTEGIVRIEESETIEEHLTPTLSVQTIGELQANQKVTISRTPVNQSTEVETITEMDTLEETAWKSETLEFKATPIAEAVKEFNSRNRDKILITDPSLENELIDGVFRSDRLEDFLASLETMDLIEVSQDPTGRTILRRR